MAVNAARAKSLFLAASDLGDLAERAAYLERECGDDDELRARVEALLRANDAALLPVAPEATVDSAPGQPQTEDYGDPTARAGAVLAGKYELVEKIGEGGMGSVFMAQQTEPVKRAVAVKVIKAGMDSKAVLARFEAERQALAMMDHPNIAKVLDAGTTDGGRSFFVMELVKGTPITRYCDEHKLTPRQRLELFVPMCQAIQHAHQKGIIHRDIKPSNVLVAMYDDRPVPKVIDFGLAKAAGQALTNKTLMTGFGAVVGTPEYMSPEQASLNNLDIDTRSDVYSLGVLLYELLTGTTPVDKKSLGKAALLEILRIVREVEAPRPSARLSTIDALPNVAANRGTEPARLSRLMKGELDWLVLKALEKDRTRRYETANALSRDIQRYLADEVVEARPPSVGYRVRKFVRRHKGQVLAASLVLVALVGGIVGTTLGLFEARRQEEEARKQEKIARDETVEKEKAFDSLAKANDKLLDVGARVLLRPLAAQVQPNQLLPPLNDQEVEALWELAAAPDERLRLRFVELALDDPVLRRRLTDRAPFALQAAVGLDPKRRIIIEELLGNRLEAREISPEEQQQMAFCLAHLGSLDRRLAARTAAILTQAMRKTTDRFAFEPLAQGLSAVAVRLEPKEATAILTQAMRKTTDTSLARSLSAVAARLEPKEAAEVAATLTKAMSNTTHYAVLTVLTQSMSAVATRLGPKEAAEVAAILTQAITISIAAPMYSNSWSMAEGLVAVAARLEPREAAEVAANLTQAMRKTTDSQVLPYMAQGLSAVLARLEPNEAGATLTQAMRQTTDPFVLGSLAPALSTVSARLEPNESAQLCGQAAATFIQAMSKTADPGAFWNLAQGLSMVSARLKPKEAAQLCGQTAATLTQAMTKTTDPGALESLARGLAALAARMEPKQAIATLTQAMTKTTDRFAFGALAQGLSSELARLEPKEAVATLTQAMSKTTNLIALGSLAQGLSAVSARLDPKEAAQLCGQTAATLTQTMSKSTDAWDIQSLVKGLLAVAARLEPTEAAATFIQAMSKSTDSWFVEQMAQGLSVAAACLEPKEAAEVAVALTQAMSKTTDSRVLQHLAKGLSAVSARLEPKEAAQLCGQTAATLTQTMSKSTDPRVFGSLAHGLSAVSARLEPKEAARLCSSPAAILAQSMSDNITDTNTLNAVGKAVLAVSARLEPKEAAQLGGQAAATLIQAMSMSDPYYLRDLASEVLAHELPPQTLVDLLKQPFCVGEPRRLVLDQLARHYHRPFADQWDFVDYVRQQKLGLDLTTPPARSRMLP